MTELRHITAKESKHGKAVVVRLGIPAPAYKNGVIDMFYFLLGTRYG